MAKSNRLWRQAGDNSLITVDEALKLSRREIGKLHKSYLNPTLVTMLTLLGFDRRFTEAKGVFIWDDEGNRYLDFLAGYGALNLGHNHPKVIEAVSMVDSCPNILQASLGALPAALAKNLALITPGDLEHCFFGNSGAEAVEGALKLARAYTRKDKIVYAEGAFHGKTLGALSVSGREKYKRAFEPLIPGCDAVSFGDLAALEEELANRDVAAFIVEPIQGEGGIVVPPSGYLKEVEALCRKYNTLLIVDEIQTGLGRCGRMFACLDENVQPDVIILSKSLSGGIIPIGAYITTQKIWKKAYGSFDRCLLHSSTFGGNTRACAAGIAAVNTILEENLAAQAAEKGSYLLSKLKELKKRHKMIKDVRGRGLLIGIEFCEPVKGFLDKLSRGTLNKLYKEYFASMIASGLLSKHRIITAFTFNNPNVLRLEPPLAVEYEHLDFLISALDETLTENRSIIKTTVRAGVTSTRRLSREIMRVGK